MSRYISAQEQGVTHLEETAQFPFHFRIFQLQSEEERQKKSHIHISNSNYGRSSLLIKGLVVHWLTDEAYNVARTSYAAKVY